MEKLCRYCDRLRPETDFGIAATYPHKVYRRHKCKDCYRETKKALIERYRQWINTYKQEQSCELCGMRDVRVLDFHHRNGREKSFELGMFQRAGGIGKIKKEIEKCMVLCANCHRIHHAEERSKGSGV